MNKTSATKEKVNTTCPCGDEGQKNVTAQLKDGTTQAYCSQECKAQDQMRQKK